MENLHQARSPAWGRSKRLRPHTMRAIPMCSTYAPARVIDMGEPQLEGNTTVQLAAIWGRKRGIGGRKPEVKANI